MALTVNLDFPHVIRIGRGVGLLTGTIDFDSSYPTGGEDASDISRYFSSTPKIILESKNGYLFEYDRTNDKIKVYYPSNPAAHTHDLTIKDDDNAATTGVALYFDEDAASVDQRVLFVSPTNADGTWRTQSTTPSDSPGAEVANGTDLSSLTGVAFIAIGLI